MNEQKLESSSHAKRAYGPQTDPWGHPCWGFVEVVAGGTYQPVPVVGDAAVQAAVCSILDVMEPDERFQLIGALECFEGDDRGALLKALHHGKGAVLDVIRRHDAAELGRWNLHDTLDGLLDGPDGWDDERDWAEVRGLLTTRKNDVVSLLGADAGTFRRIVDRREPALVALLGDPHGHADKLEQSFDTVPDDVALDLADALRILHRRRRKLRALVSVADRTSAAIAAARQVGPWLLDRLQAALAEPEGYRGDAVKELDDSLDDTAPDDCDEDLLLDAGWPLERLWEALGASREDDERAWWPQPPGLPGLDMLRIAIEARLCPQGAWPTPRRPILHARCPACRGPALPLRLLVAGTRFYCVRCGTHGKGIEAFRGLIERLRTERPL